MELSIVASSCKASFLSSMIHSFLCLLRHCHHIALWNVLRYAPFLNVSLVSLLTIDVSVLVLSLFRLALRI